MELRAKASISLVTMGIVASGYSVFHHYAIRYSDSFTSFCNFSEELNFDAVALHASSEVLGVPIAVYGLLAYVAVGSLIIDMVRNGESRLHFLGPLTTCMCVYSLYLAYVSKFVIGSLCIVCAGMYAINLLLFLIQVSWHSTLTGLARSFGKLFRELQAK